jgi:predicted PurR-regulated permease PerM
MRVNGLTKGFFILIVFIVTLAFFDVLSPYYSAILWAAILAVIFNPVKNKIRTRLGERNGLAALMTIVIICLIVLRRWRSFSRRWPTSSTGVQQTAA